MLMQFILLYFSGRLSIQQHHIKIQKQLFRIILCWSLCSSQQNKLCLGPKRVFRKTCIQSLRAYCSSMCDSYLPDPDCIRPSSRPQGQTFGKYRTYEKVNENTHKHTHTYIHTNIHTYIHTHTTHTYIYIHIYIYI